MIILHTAAGNSQQQIAAMLGSSVSTVKRTRTRWRALGEAGLIDRREDNAPAKKADEAYAAKLLEVLANSPRHHGQRRPTWTQELMIKVMCQCGQVRISRTTIGRLQRRLGVRRGMPKPTAHCPCSRRQKASRIRLLRKLVASLPPNEAALWEDEIDVHLNPRIGADWVLPGTQRLIPTPGKNVKRYVGGALDALTDRLVWVRAERKNSLLFIELLKKL